MWGAWSLTPRGHSMSPKMFLMQVTRYWCSSAVMPSKFLHARMTTSRGWLSSHSEISVSVSCTGDRSLGGRGPPRLSKGLPSHAPDPGSGPDKPQQSLGLPSWDAAAKVAAGKLPLLGGEACACACTCDCACPPAGTARAHVGAVSCGGPPLPAAGVQSDVPAMAAADPKALQGAGH